MINSTTTRQSVVALSFVVDMASLVRGNGNQVDWTKVSDKYRRGSFQVKAGTGGAARGATSLPVIALDQALNKGDVLDFGQVASVVVTVGPAALAAATSITVTALSGPVPTGTVLDFGTNKFARLTANALAGATTLTVAALPTALAGGETATYLGGDLHARLSADAAAAATSVTVEALEFAIPQDAIAYGIGGLLHRQTGSKYIPSGTVVARDTNGKIFPRGDVTGAETSWGIIETDAVSDSRTDALTGYSVLFAGIYYENMLPDADPTTGLISSTYKTELRAGGGQFMFRKAHDSRST